VDPVLFHAVVTDATVRQVSESPPTYLINKEADYPKPVRAWIFWKNFLTMEVTMPLSSLREYLDKHEIKYVVISHSVAYTAQRSRR